MARQATLLDAGKILEWAERGLLKVWLYVEKGTERHLLRAYKKDRHKMESRARKKRQRKKYRELGKWQDSKPGRLEKQRNISERLGELEKEQAGSSRENEHER